MKLKLLKYIRTIFICLTAVIVFYLTDNVKNSYTLLERENKILLDQKETYQKIIGLDKTDSLEKNELFKLLQITNSSLEEIKSEKNFGIETNIWILIGTFYLISRISKYISSQIEKLAESEKEIG